MIWPFRKRTRPENGPTTRELAQDALARITLLEDRLEDALDALKREAARVEQANRRAEAREEKPNGATGHASLWDIARSLNR